MRSTNMIITLILLNTLVGKSKDVNGLVLFGFRVDFKQTIL